MGAWVSYLLEQIGFTEVKSGTVVLCGLDNAGKTTLLLRLTTGVVSCAPPTKRARDESFNLGGVSFRAWDLGGHESVRHLWSSFYGGANGIVFMIDAADTKRFEEVGEELELLIDDLAEMESPVPLAILLNKCDLTSAKEESEIIEAIGLDEICSDFKGISARVFGCSVFENRGFQPAFKWLADFL